MHPHRHLRNQRSLQMHPHIRCTELFPECGDNRVSSAEKKQRGPVVDNNIITGDGMNFPAFQRNGIITPNRSKRCRSDRDLDAALHPEATGMLIEPEFLPRQALDED